MNTFEQLIGRKILKVFRIDKKEDYEFGFPLALFLQLDQNWGLLIGQDSNHNTTTLSNTTLESVRNDFGTDYDETSLNELKPIDRLNSLVGQTIKSIKVGEFNHDKSLGDNFLIKPGQYAGVILEVDNQKLTIFYQWRMQRNFIQ
jgi:hypothetical protein